MSTWPGKLILFYILFSIIFESDPSNFGLFSCIILDTTILNIQCMSLRCMLIFFVYFNDMFYNHFFPFLSLSLTFSISCPSFPLFKNRFPMFAVAIDDWMLWLNLFRKNIGGKWILYWKKFIRLNNSLI